MREFQRLHHDQLYIGEKEEGDVGYFYLYAREPEAISEKMKDSLTLMEAVGDREHQICFLFARKMLPAEDEGQAKAVAAEIGEVLEAAIRSERYILWLSDVDCIEADTVDVLGLDAGAGKVTAGLERKELWGNLTYEIKNGTCLKWQQEGADLSGIGGESMEFQGVHAVRMSSLRGERISCGGEDLGCVSWKCSVNLGEMAKKMMPGFYYSYGEEEEKGEAGFSFMCMKYLETRQMGTKFYVQLDLMDVQDGKTEGGCGRRSFFEFLGTEYDGSQTVFASWFQTIYGKPLFLRPVGRLSAGHLSAGKLSAGRLYFSLEGRDDIILEPAGDFVLAGTEMEGKPKVGGGRFPGSEMAALGGEDEEILLLCGLSGTECFRLHRGDCMRFYSGNPAMAKNFPAKAASTVGEPVDLNQPLLDDRATTSWLGLESDRGVEYLSQPRGCAHYALDGRADGMPILRHDQKGLSVCQEGVSFPCVPYGGLTGGKNAPSAMGWVREYEHSVLALERKRQLDAPLSRELEQMQMRQRMREEALAEKIRQGGMAFSDGEVRGAEMEEEFATPSGQMVARSPEGVWKRVVFAGSGYLGQASRLYLERPHNLLRQSLEASSLFMVVANQDYLGEITSSAEDLERMSFHNGIAMGGWKFEIAPGKKSAYNAYRGIMIVKGRRGKIFDPEDGEREAGQAKSLAANPSLWTNAAKLAAPPSEGTGAGDADQLVNLATWMMKYCREAYQKEKDGYFENFCQIIQDEEWQGVLFLNIPMEREALPEQLQGLASGLPESTDLHAHHIGIKTSPVSVDDGRLRQDGDSSLFGLVYFRDQQFRGKPVAPDQGAYDFKLLELKVLFENSEVKKFVSHAQLTLNELFGLQVSRTEGDVSAYNSMLLSGMYQNDNGVASYRLRNEHESKFCFQESPIQAIRIDNVTMATEEKGERNYRFDLDGSMDFVLWKENDVPVDFLSFGTEDGRGEGLRFRNLGIALQEAGAGADGRKQRSMKFDIGNLIFDVERSLVRKNSLFESLNLQLEEMVEGTEKNPPSDLGYLQVRTDWNLRGVQGRWYGLAFALDMGTLGELAGKAGIVSRLLIAFGPGREIYLGIRLPGSGKADFLSLQNLLKLSVDQIWLKYDGGRKAFMILFTNIALKLLGLLSVPPAGSTMFYLFGDTGTEKNKELGWYAVYKKAEKKALEERRRGQDA